MAHQIKEDRFLAYDGKPAWHQLGDVKLEAATFAEAQAELLRGGSYSLEPVGTYNGKTGKWELIPNKKNVVFRDPNATEGPSITSFGIVSNDFRIIESEALAETLSPVLKKAGLTVATAGMLRNGSSLFIAMDAGERDIVGENYRDYLTFDLSYEPGRTMKVYSTPVRTVCANTQALGLDMSALSFDVSHSGDVDAKMALAATFIAQYDERREFFAQFMEALAEYRVNDDEIAAVLEAAYPFQTRPKSLTQTVDKMTDEQIAALVAADDAVSELVDDFTSKERAWVNSIARSEERRELVRERFDVFSQDHTQFAGTGYALYNAVTYVADWRNGRGDIAASVAGGTRLSEKMRASDALAGIVA